MVERYPTYWKLVDVVQVPTLSEKVDEMALCCARRPGMLSHSAQVPSSKLAATEKEDEVEEEVKGWEPAAAMSPLTLGMNQLFSEFEQSKLFQSVPA